MIEAIFFEIVSHVDWTGDTSVSYQSERRSDSAQIVTSYHDVAEN